MWKKESPIPNKLKSLYEVLNESEPISKTTSSLIYKVKSRKDNEIYNLRVIDINSSFYGNNPDTAANLFMKELLYLCCVQPESINVQDFAMEAREASEDGKDRGLKIGYITKPAVFFENQKSDFKSIDLGKLLNDLLDDIEFMKSRLEIMDISNINLKSVSQFKSSAVQNKKKEYYLTGWLENISREPRYNPLHSQILTSEGPSKDFLGEIQDLGRLVLVLCGVEASDLVNIGTNSTLKLIINGLDNMYGQWKPLIEEMTEKDPAKRIKLSALREKLALLSAPRTKSIEIQVDLQQSGQIYQPKQEDPVVQIHLRNKYSNQTTKYELTRDCLIHDLIAASCNGHAEIWAENGTTPIPEATEVWKFAGQTLIVMPK